MGFYPHGELFYGIYGRCFCVSMSFVYVLPFVVFVRGPALCWPQVRIVSPIISVFLYVVHRNFKKNLTSKYMVKREFKQEDKEIFFDDLLKIKIKSDNGKVVGFLSRGVGFDSQFCRGFLSGGELIYGIYVLSSFKDVPEPCNYKSERHFICYRAPICSHRNFKTLTSR